MDQRATTAEADIVHGLHPKPVYIYQLPLRLWHWGTALAIPVLSVTGYLIAKPIDGMSMYWPRLLHFAFGELLAVGMLWRIYGAAVGNRHARQIFYVPVWSKRFWLELGEEMAWYAFLRKKPKRYVGHNPLARVAMSVLFLYGTFFMILSGFALYGEDDPGGWVSKGFGWVFAIMGTSQTVRTWHHVGMWALLMFSLVHIYFVIREDIMGRTSMVSAMVNGWRTFKS